ncbi:GH92 family glycosyl hydrolase [Nakamurella aerolata]|uniref:Glycoside hydrolase family 92 protein n=1 Tax=Nakamurella aerolata TaxID=1656892 RepID=A0A849A8R3_9ACTN|nr:GH92 family glycosyl hydrolase [Nakamurella aerolata]NNG36387.1 glycoside hydrolase family 92 protein [Nakamurella aerolata]
MPPAPAAPDLTGSSPAGRRPSRKPVTGNRLSPFGGRAPGSRSGRTGRLTAAVGVVALGLSSLLAVPAAAAGPAGSTAAGATATATAAFPDDPTTLVNTSIGNNGDGTTFPGAAMPFGMVQNSPDTRLKQYASYNYADTNTLGFSQIHLSGVGCQTNGLVRLMPTTGAVTSADPASYRSAFSHQNESASPGYYSVQLDKYGIAAELGATERTGLHRYSYPQGQQQNVLIEVGEGNGYTFGSEVKVVGNDTIEGRVKGGNFCWETGSERYDIFFSAKFDRPFSSFGSWSSAGAPAPGQRDASSARQNGRLGAYASFDAAGGRQVQASVGISYTSVDGARRNRVAETERDGTSIGFQPLRQQAHQAWLKQLNRVKVAGGTGTDQRTFYSALYRSLLHPSLGSDVDGAYRGFDNKVHTSTTPYYQMFSLWDTYRAQNQLVAMLEPQRAADMARSILAIYRDGGWLPRWALGNGETNVMSGDPVTPFIVTLWQRGILDVATARQLFDALWRNATEVPADQSIFRGRDGNPSYLQGGYIGYRDVGGYKFGDTRQAGSATVEYAYGDCMLATMARGLGEQAKATELDSRCGNIGNIWNPASTSKGYTGFPQARAADGSWVGPTDPANSVGFHEGTAWQYQWLAQQNPPALYGLMGGTDKAEQRLDTFFDLPRVLESPQTAAKDSWVIGAYDYHNNFAFNPNNEPDLHAPWMYAWTSSPWKTSAVMRAARPLFTDDAYGMPGNDDLGTISSWLVFAMVGMFEAQPGSGTFVLSAPMFERVEITPNGGNKIQVTAPGAKADALQYISSVRLGNPGRPVRYSKSWLSTNQLSRGVTVDITLTTDPAATSWGTRTIDQPPTFGPGDWSAQ